MSYSFPVIIEKYDHPIVTLEQAKRWIRMDIEGYEAEDSLIEEIIASAVSSVETNTGLSLGISLYEWNCKGRPCEFFGASNIREIVSVGYWEGPTETALQNTDYRLVKKGVTSVSINWNPDLEISRNLEYTIRFKAGFEEGKVPADLMQAIRARISEYYDARGDGVSEKRTLSDKLLNTYRNAYAG